MTLALLTTVSCASVPASRAAVSEPGPSRNPGAEPGSQRIPNGRPGPGAAPGPSREPAGTPAARSVTPALPKPTGAKPVGVTTLHLKDTSRTDPWVPSVKARELMISLWYPATAPGRRRARYMTPKESELLLKDGEITGVPYDVLSKTRTNAFQDAEPAGRKRGLPLVVLSPGFTKPRSELTALAEELASKGYVVAGIDHTYENVAMTFPGGRVTTCAACEIDHDPAFWTKLSAGRAADVSFVLDQLTARRPKTKAATLIDPSRIAMAGQSVGGASTITAMVKDTRIRAGVNTDGTTDGSIPAGGLSRPFMFLGKPATYTPGSGRPEAATWEHRLEAPDRMEALAAAHRRGAPVLHRLSARWSTSSASTSAPRWPAPARWRSPADTSAPSSTCTCVASRSPCWTSRRPATRRSPSAR